MTERRGTLPMGLWLALALGALVGIPPLCNWGVSQALALWQRQAAQSQVAAARGVLGAKIARWRDPAWQHRAGAALTRLGVDVVLVDRAGVEFATSDALQVRRQTASIRQKFRLDPAPTDSLPFETVAIVDPASPAMPSPAARHPLGVAYLWFTQPLAGVPPPWAATVAGGVALVLTLSVVAWFLARSVLRPLAAMSRAARQIAGGNLDVRLPPSRTREVAEVATALAAMSAALQQSLERQATLEEERRLFIGAVAHDLRTPLFALRGYLKGLESGVVATPEKMAHYVRACGSRADALEKLIAELFAYARIEYLEQEPRREPLELGALLREVVAGTQPAATAKGITLALHEAPARCPLLGDSLLLGRAVQNLLDNALRHTPSGGCIHVRWQQDGSRLLFQVEDTGPGIATCDLPHLFTPLYRGEASRNRQTGGAGLGLTIARRILQAHGGDLTAANSPTGGAVLTGTLPADQHAQPAVAAVTAAGECD